MVTGCYQPSTYPNKHRETLFCFLKNKHKTEAYKTTLISVLLTGPFLNGRWCPIATFTHVTLIVIAYLIIKVVGIYPYPKEMSKRSPL